MSERPEGAEIVGIRRKRGKRGDIIAAGAPRDTWIALAEGAEAGAGVGVALTCD